MIQVVRTAWSRSVRSWRFWVTATLGLFIFFLPMIQYADPWLHNPIPRDENFFVVTLYFLGAYLFATWPVFVPLLAALPAGDIVAVDRRRGLDALEITRVGWGNYIAGNLLGNALVGLSAVGVAMAVALVTAAVVYPMGLPHLIGWHATLSELEKLPYSVKQSGVFADSYPPSFQKHFFWSSPGTYVALAIGVALWAVVVLSSLSVAVSAWIRLPVLTLAAPVVLFLVATVASQGLLMGRLNPWIYAGAYLWWPPLPSWGALFSYWGAPAVAVAVVAVWIGRFRREWPQGSVGQ